MLDSIGLILGNSYGSSTETIGTAAQKVSLRIVLELTCLDIPGYAHSSPNSLLVFLSPVVSSERVYEKTVDHLTAAEFVWVALFRVLL